VVETGNITRASEKLNLAQTALGQQIRLLEESLGVPLLIRHSRGISLTEPGKVLHQHAVAILKSIEAARTDVLAHSQEKKEVINLGVTPSIQALIGPEILVSAKEELPRISLRMVEELSFILIDALQRGELDLALAYEIDDRRGLATTALAEEQLLFIRAPGTDSSEGPVRFQKAISTELALVSDRDIVWRLLHATAEQLSLRVNVAFEVQSMPAIKTLVMRGVATSVVPFGVVAEEIQQGLIVACPIVQPSIKRTLFLSRMDTRGILPQESELMAFLDSIVLRLVAKMGHYGSMLAHDLGAQRR